MIFFGDGIHFELEMLQTIVAFFGVADAAHFERVVGPRGGINY